MKFHECQHVLANGNTCRAPRLRNEPFCYFHVAARDRVRRQRLAAERRLPLQVPVLEDRMTIQLALSDVVNALLSDRIDAKKAALTLYALQTASSNLKGVAVEKPKTYSEYVPELDASLPDTEEATTTSAAHAELAEMPYQPPQLAVVPAQTNPEDVATDPSAKKKRRREKAKIPPKKPVTSVPKKRDPTMLLIHELAVAAKKKELLAIRKYTPAFRKGTAMPLPSTIEDDETAQERHDQEWGEIFRDLRKSSQTKIKGWNC
ncbi:hypothetical protein Acid345_2036 [Candidatus Koribacter versatilis Ellin345]|uniref:Uncharacterized protein n=1 Tax=Koribacter versatilis (strain Ellin345) TaxID=204669 RepID=Q1IQ13_KORVE|nr:hypothetical protein [Candidatus Koribacter versatilis]ABF41037.1 hypothetical protein Acid345_2036 [Candidatus Koribacter versatilis Ellin345]